MDMLIIVRIIVSHSHNWLFGAIFFAISTVKKIAQQITHTQGVQKKRIKLSVT